MPRLSGVFEYFQNIDKIPLQDIRRWIKTSNSDVVLQNFIANRLLYPQAIPSSSVDLEMDLAILRECIIRNIQYFLVNKNLVIPYQFLEHFYDLKQLAWAFVDAYRFSSAPKQQIMPIMLAHKTKQEILGSLVSIKFTAPKGVATIKAEDQKPQKIGNGSLLIIPNPKASSILQFDIQGGSLVSLSSGSVEIDGGALGVMVDGRQV